MTIDAKHRHYEEFLPKWEKIENITKIKDVGQYLMRLNPHDKSRENADRNSAYKDRAVFYAIAEQTVSGLLGVMFKKKPSINLPSVLGYMVDNADGAGVSMVQQAQSLSSDVISKSRGGLYVSYPRTDGPVSRQAILNGEAVATINQFSPEDIINWRLRSRGSKVVLELVVLAVSDERVGSDGYSMEVIPQRRELFLDEDGYYAERTWEKDKDNQWAPVDDPHYPTDHSGNRFKEIPFVFVGAENNDSTVDSPNMLALVELNIGHYRNSADWEDSVWFSGQPQPWMSGVTQAHVDMMKKNDMYVGSRNVLGVPSGEKFGFAAPPHNPIVRQAMVDKVDLMVQLGARMIQPGTAAKTATQVGGEREVQHSVLSLIASNISDAYRQALRFAGMFMGTGAESTFELNEDFVDPEADPSELKEIIAGFVQGAIPARDYVEYMQGRSLFDPEKNAEDYIEQLGDVEGSGAGMGQLDDPDDIGGQ